MTLPVSKKLASSIVEKCIRRWLDIIIIMYSTPTEVQMLRDIKQTKKKTNYYEEDIVINISLMSESTS